jgi:hypothetical protein
MANIAPLSMLGSEAIGPVLRQEHDHHAFDTSGFSVAPAAETLGAQLLPQLPGAMTALGSPRAYILALHVGQFRASF